MSVLRAKIQRLLLEDECCISALPGRGKKGFFKHDKGFSLHSKKRSNLVKLPGNVVLGFMQKILAYMPDTSDFCSLAMKVLVPRVTSQRETTCCSERTFFSML